MDVNILLYMEAWKHSVFIDNNCSFSHANFKYFPFHWNTVLKPQCEWTYWSSFPTDYSVAVIVTVSALIVILTWITSVQRNIISFSQTNQPTTVPWTFNYPARHNYCQKDPTNMFSVPLTCVQSRTWSESGTVRGNGNVSGTGNAYGTMPHPEVHSHRGLGGSRHLVGSGIWSGNETFLWTPSGPWAWIWSEKGSGTGCGGVPRRGSSVVTWGWSVPA